LPAAAGAAPGGGAGVAAGAFGAACGVIERCLPKLPPPPKRLASAVAANKPALVKAIVNSIKNRFMYFSVRVDNISKIESDLRGRYKLIAICDFQMLMCGVLCQVTPPADGLAKFTELAET
jgi:hypothetical protein